MDEQEVNEGKKRQKLDDRTRQSREGTFTSIEKEIMKRAKEWWGGEAKLLKIVNRWPKFAEGSLYYIWVIKEENGKEEEDDMVAYVVGNQIKLCWDFQELGNSVGPTPGMLANLGQVLQLGGIAGIIAVILTVTFSILILGGRAEGNTELIDLMKNALLLILGFYFGSKISK